MKYILILLIPLLLTGCPENCSKPVYQIGEEVLIANKIKGRVVQVRNWCGNSAVSDYQVLIDNTSATIWYDQKDLSKTN